jgi:hypothetical protein
MENVEYTEWVPAGALVKGSFAMVTAIVVFVSIVIFLFSSPLEAEDIFGVSFSWVVLAVLLLVFWNYRGLRIQIKEDKLFVDYGRFDKKSFALTDIVNCKKTKSFGRYLGVGVRYGLDGSLAYTTSLGSAVEVTSRIGRVFVFSSKEPDKVCEIINSRT